MLYARYFFKKTLEETVLSGLMERARRNRKIPFTEYLLWNFGWVAHPYNQDITWLLWRLKELRWLKQMLGSDRHGSASYISLWTPPNLWSIIPDNEIMTLTCPREKCPIKNKTIRNIINNKNNRTSAVGSIASWGTLRLDPSICWNLMANG